MQGAAPSAIAGQGTARVGRSYPLLLAGLALPQVASIVIVAVTAWSMGPSGRGEVAFAQATATMIAVVGGWGFYLSASATQAPIPRQYLDLTLGLTASISIGVVISAALAPRGLLAMPVALPIGFAAVMTGGTTYCQRIAQARVSDLEYLVIGSIPPIVSLVTVLPTVLIGAGSGSVIGVWGMGSSLGFLIAVFRTRRLFPSDRAGPLAPLYYFRSGFAVGAANVSSFLALRADTVILGVASTAIQVGYYSVAVAMSNLLLYGSEVFSLRTISRFGSGQDPESYAAESFRRASRAAGLAVALAIPFGIVGWLVLRFGFSEFQPAFGAFFILCIAAVPASYVRVLVSAASMLGLRGLLSWYSVACFALLVLYVPAGHYGATFLAGASLLVYTLQAGLVALLVRKARVGLA